MSKRNQLVMFAAAFLLLSAMGSFAEPPSMLAQKMMGDDPGGDTRTPLPLTAPMANHQKQMMRGHLEAVQAIIAGLAADNMPAIVRAADSMGYTTMVANMCRHLGAAAPDDDFVNRALAFHKSAGAIADAARKGDRLGVLGALNHTMGSCVACHATYRQQVVDTDTFKRLTEARQSPLH